MAEHFPRNGLHSAGQHLLRCLSSVFSALAELLPPGWVLHTEPCKPCSTDWLTRKPASSFGAVGGRQFQRRKVVQVIAQEFHSAGLSYSQPPHLSLQAEAHLRQAEVRSALQPVLQKDPWLPVKDHDGHPAPACRTKCALKLAAACEKPPTSPSWHLPSSKRATVLLASQLQHPSPAQHELSGNQRSQAEETETAGSRVRMCWRADLIYKQHGSALTAATVRLTRCCLATRCVGRTALPARELFS